MINPHRFNLFRVAFVGALSYISFRVVEVAAVAAPITADPAVPVEPVATADAAASVAESQAATSDEAPATASINVPAQHVSLLERAAALLSRGEQWIADNIEAGISHFEGIVGEAKKDL